MTNPSTAEAPFKQLRTRGAAVRTLAFALLCAAPIDALADCKPKRPLPPVVLKNMGVCGFDPQTLSFAGEPAQQAACLMRPVAKIGKLGPVLDKLPNVLVHVGRPNNLPAREALSAHLSKLDLEWDFAAYLWQPVSRARDHDENAPPARYFVIHDTSGPNFARKPWPGNLDEDAKINSLARHRCSDGWEGAHAFINRSGKMLRGHDFAEPWRATKFERAVGFGTDLKGLFLHVEMTQPRRRDPKRGRRDDSVAPEPGFSQAQYDRLALLYTIASVRADAWLVPATHAAIDSGIRNGHDDPQNFDLAAFSQSLERLLDQLHGRPALVENLR
jgi:hypothetical protein